jgi:hypothetical protein
VSLINVFFLRLPLAIWVGATILAAIAAPAVFRTIPSRDLAGATFGAILQRLEAVKHVLSVVMVLGVLETVSRGNILPPAEISAIGIFLAIASNVYVSMVVRPRMAYFRNQAGSFDDVSEDNPWRRRFQKLHRRASVVVAAGLLLAAAALVTLP